MVEPLGNTPAGVIEPIPNLSYRERSRYWRPVKDKKGDVIDWIQTEMLPSDLGGMSQYLGRGFRLDNPKEVIAEKELSSAKANIEKEVLLARIKKLEEALANRPTSRRGKKTKVTT